MTLLAGRPPAPTRWPGRLGLLLLAAVGLVALLNAWRYTSDTAIPVIMFDAWYFADVFVTPQVGGELDWRDFFVKRDAGDHAQPLHKLWLAANTAWFGLDFRLDALVAFGGLVISVLALLALGLTAVRERPLRVADGVALCAIPLIMFSLNSPEIYEWSLVTQYYLVLPFALLLFVIAARGDLAPVWALPLAAFACLVVLDGGGLLAAIATALGLMLRSARTGVWRDARRSFAGLAAAVLLFKIGFWLLLPPPPPAQAVQTGFAALADLGSAWRLLAIPATSSLVHWDGLVVLLESPEAARRAAAWIGAAVIALHAVFWISLWRTIAHSRVSVVACMLMLYVYGMWAGVVLGRVPLFGADYLWQHRYVAFFQLANIALVLQWLAATARDAEHASAWAREWSLVVVLPLICGLGWLQWSFSDRAWERSPYVRANSADMARTLYCLAEHPDSTQVVCPPQHDVCKWPTPMRARLVAVLRDHRLNVFSPNFQTRYAVQPAAGDDRYCLPPSG